MFNFQIIYFYLIIINKIKIDLIDFKYIIKKFFLNLIIFLLFFFYIRNSKVIKYNRV